MEIYLKDNEILFLKTVCSMLEDNVKGESKNITAYSIAKNSGVSYKTIRKNIKKIKDL